MSDAKKGKPLSLKHPAHTGNLHRGMKRKPKTCAAISAALTGKKLSPEHCKSIGDARRGKPMKRFGATHWAWKGGDSRQRYPREYMAWALKVKRRDRFVCQQCGYSAKKGMHAHHIKAWADFPGLRYEPSNGTTLCPTCHRTSGHHVGVSRTQRHDPPRPATPSEQC